MSFGHCLSVFLSLLEYYRKSLDKGYKVGRIVAWHNLFVDGGWR